MKVTEAVENEAAFGGKALLSPGWQMGPRGGGRVEAATPLTGFAGRPLLWHEVVRPALT